MVECLLQLPDFILEEISIEELVGLLNFPFIAGFMNSDAEKGIWYCSDFLRTRKVRATKHD